MSGTVEGSTTVLLAVAVGAVGLEAVVVVLPATGVAGGDELAGVDPEAAVGGVAAVAGAAGAALADVAEGAGANASVALESESSGMASVTSDVASGLVSESSVAPARSMTAGRRCFRLSALVAELGMDGFALPTETE